MEQKLGKKRDIVWIVILLLVGILAGFLMNRNRETGDRVVISIDGNPVEQFSLSKDLRYEILGYEDSGRNILVIENGTAQIQEADCPDLICARHKPIHQVGETIICLPHRVVIEIKG